MISKRDVVALAVAFLMLVLTEGNLPFSVGAALAVWFVPVPRIKRYTPSAERRYRMRETERRNKHLTK